MIAAANARLAALRAASSPTEPLVIAMSELIWDADWLPPIERRVAIEEIVRNSILNELEDLGKPEDLVFHHVFLGDDIDGPCVLVYGIEGSPAFHLEYDANPQWASLSDDDDA